MTIAVSGYAPYFKIQSMNKEWADMKQTNRQPDSGFHARSARSGF